jgi:hypothetical protein
MGAMSLSEPGLIVAEDDVERPMQGIFDQQWPRTMLAARLASRMADEMK